MKKAHGESKYNH